jgi:hypothetical protein
MVTPAATSEKIDPRISPVDRVDRNRIQFALDKGALLETTVAGTSPATGSVYLTNV